MEQPVVDQLPEVVLLRLLEELELFPSLFCRLVDFEWNLDVLPLLFRLVVQVHADHEIQILLRERFALRYRDQVVARDDVEVLFDELHDASVDNHGLVLG